MHINIRRALAGFVATAVCAVGTVVGGATPAHALASGYLVAKGTGSLYTANDYINLGAVPGGNARTFTFKIVNTGPTSQQFKVTAPTSSPGITRTLLQGSSPLPLPYYTAPVAPGGSLTLKLRVQLAGGLPQAEYVTYVELRDPETSTLRDSFVADLHATYETGTTNHDLFLKTGTQPYVGGSLKQIQSASAIKPGSTATFRLRLQNNSGSPTAIGLKYNPAYGCLTSYSITVKQGTKNVTSAVDAGAYSTGILAPGARTELKVMIKLLEPIGCASSYFGYTASTPAGAVNQYAHVLVAAA